MRPDLEKGVAGLAEHPVSERAEADERQLGEIVDGDVIERPEVASTDMVPQALKRALEQHAVIDADGQALGCRQCEQIARFIDRCAHGLFQEDADAGLQGRLRDPVMVVGRYEHVDDVETLFGQHRLQRGISRHAPALPERLDRGGIQFAHRRQLYTIRRLDRASVEIRDVTRANNCGTDGTSNREISCVQEQFLWLLRSWKEMMSYRAVSLEPQLGSQRIFYSLSHIWLA